MRKIDEIFNDRTCYSFSSKKIEHNVLKQIYDLMKLGPTSANTCPLRIIFVESPAEKDKLSKCVMPGNVNKVLSASCTAIFAYDTEYYKHMEKLCPHDAGIRQYMASSEAIIMDTAKRNSVLQAAYFMMIARGFGVDVGAMSGFDKEAIDKTFLQGTSYKSDFICNLGYKVAENPHPRLPRLDFDEACKVI